MHPWESSGLVPVGSSTPLCPGKLFTCVNLHGEKNRRHPPKAYVKRKRITVPNPEKSALSKTFAKSSLFGANFVPLDDEVKCTFWYTFSKVHSPSDLERKKKCNFPQNHQRNVHSSQKLTFSLHSKSRRKVHFYRQAALFKVPFPPRFGTTLTLLHFITLHPTFVQSMSYFHIYNRLFG